MLVYVDIDETICYYEDPDNRRYNLSLPLQKNIDKSYIDEIQKDIKRLNIITERFSNIGSVPTLEKKDIISETESTIDYMKTRSSNSIKFEFIKPNEKIITLLNPFKS